MKLLSKRNETLKQANEALNAEIIFAISSDIAAARLRLAEEVEKNEGVSPCDSDVDLIDYIA